MNNIFDENNFTLKNQSMKNFNEAVEKLRKEQKETNHNIREFHFSDIFIALSIISGKLSTVQNLLRKIIIENNIELKDDDGNIIPIDEYIEFCDEANSLSLFQTLGSEV